MKKAGLTSLNMVPKIDVNFSIVCSITDDGLHTIVKEYVYQRHFTINKRTDN